MLLNNAAHCHKNINLKFKSLQNCKFKYECFLFKLLMGQLSLDIKDESCDALVESYLPVTDTEIFLVVDKNTFYSGNDT